MTIRASANPEFLVAMDYDQVLALATACKTAIALHISPPTVEQIQALRPPEGYIDILRSTLQVLLGALETMRKPETP